VAALNSMNAFVKINHFQSLRDVVLQKSADIAEMGQPYLNTEQTPNPPCRVRVL